MSLWDLLIVLSAAAVFAGALAACNIARASVVEYCVVVLIGLAVAVVSAAIYWRLRARLVGRGESQDSHGKLLAVFVTLPLLWLPAWTFIAFNVARLTLRLLQR